jgi:hypothetical protein
LKILIEIIIKYIYTMMKKKFQIQIYFEQYNKKILALLKFISNENSMKMKLFNILILLFLIIINVVIGMYIQ